MKRLKKLWYRTKISYYERLIYFRQRECQTNQISHVAYIADKAHYQRKIAELTNKIITL